MSVAITIVLPTREDHDLLERRAARVAIVGRPNVGKSSLFNRLVGYRRALVDPAAGVTRDRVEAVVELEGRRFVLVDTGGLGLADGEPLGPAVAAQVERALAQADLVLFVVDLRAGVTPLDEEVAACLRRRGARVILVGNKADTPTTGIPEAAEAARLGFGPALPVSAVHGRGVAELQAAVLAGLPEAPADPALPAGLRLAVVGRQNVGKSTLVNCLVGEERVLVSPVPGTTRDAVDVAFQYEGRQYVLVDTAGVRRRRSLRTDLDRLAQAQARASLQRADVVLLLLDASQPVTAVEKRLAALIRESARPCVLTLNKWDLAAERGVEPEAYEPYLRTQLPGLVFAPIAIIAARTGFNVGALLDVARSLHRQAGRRVSTGALNRVLRAAGLRRLAARRGRIPRLYYATQVATHPPTFALFVNDPALFSAEVLRFYENRLREEFSFPEVPLKLLLRPRVPAGARERR